MEMADEPEIGYVGDRLSPSGGFLDPEIPFSSVHALLPSNSHVDFTAFDIFSFESRKLPPTWRMDTSSSTDSLSDNSAPMLITEDNGIPSMLEATRSQEDRLCQNPQGCCISVATGILSSMHVESSSCTHAQGSGRHPQLSRAADAILSMNQAALRAVVSVVQCSCYRRPQVLLIVTVICSEITACVQARMVTFLRTQLRALTSALDNSESDSATVHV
ncbi:conserved hypothetical protein [Aspergillus terreus NIH2624]|uniref:Aflatoxin regulatory protein domain-containing protein n=1 Tax=Aspergillus terreus (strain NIH 2624 / FGSC A1156) TaxID=341663 RepID=Q0CHP0_ASPTN|nr:uncharacterized protein ATEG_06794 [Aspergillus terreus NIH2624]EAU33338.1 conserved hypothetical protein [Aspergillus terreus NIH2624]